MVTVVRVVDRFGETRLAIVDAVIVGEIECVVHGPLPVEVDVRELVLCDLLRGRSDGTLVNLYQPSLSVGPIGQRLDPGVRMDGRRSTEWGGCRRRGRGDVPVQVDVHVLVEIEARELILCVLL